MSGEEEARAQLTSAQREISRLMAMYDKNDETVSFARAAAMRSDAAGCYWW